MSILRYGTLVNYLLCVHFILFECGASGGSQKPKYQESHPAGNWTWKKMQVLRMETIIILTTCVIINERKVSTFTTAMMHHCAHMELQRLQWHCWRIPFQYQCRSPNFRVAASSIFSRYNYSSWSNLRITSACSWFQWDIFQAVSCSWRLVVQVIQCSDFSQNIYLPSGRYRPNYMVRSSTYISSFCSLVSGCCRPCVATARY